MSTKVHTRRLDNGLTLIARENHATPVVELQMWVNVGAADERDGGEEGIAHVHEHMLFKGTTNRAVGQIAKDVESAGGDINAYTSHEQTVYHITLATQFFDQGLDILADVLVNSTFDAAELEKELRVIADEEIKRSRDMPQRRLQEELFALAYEKHPYRRPVIGYEEVVRKFTREGILDFYHVHYRPDNVTFVIVGDVDAEAALDAAAAKFAGHTAHERVKRVVERAREPEQHALRAKVIRAASAEYHFAAAFHVPGVTHDDVPALDVLAVVLGQGESSRLVRQYRIAEPLVTDVYASAYTPRDPGLFLVGGSCEGANVERVIAGVLADTFAATAAKVSDAEVAKARELLLAEAIYRDETVQGQARRLGYFATTAGDPEWDARYYRRLERLTAADVLAAARHYLSSANCTIMLLAPEGDASVVVDDEKLAAMVHGAYLKAHPGGVAKAAAKGGARKPEVREVTLSNGMQVLLRREDAVPIVAVHAAALGGSRFESDETQGSHHLLARLMTRGTPTRTAEEIAHELDATASSIGGFAGRNSIGMRGEFLSRNLARGLDLFAECMFEATLPPRDLENERASVLQEIRARKDRLSSLAFDLFSKTLYREHPYRLMAMGEPEVVQGLSGDGLRTLAKSVFRPGNLRLAVVGDFDPDEVAARLEAIPGFEHGHVPLPVGPKPERAAERARVALTRHDKTQVHLVYGYLGTTLDAPNRFAFEMLNATLAGMGGRLFEELRDRQSLAYAITSLNTEGVEPGSFAVYMGTSPEKLEAALFGIRNELARVAETGITEDELKRQKRYLTGTYAIGLQRAASRAAKLNLNRLYQLPADALETYTSSIEAVTREEVHAVARGLFNPTNFTLALAVPRETQLPERFVALVNDLRGDVSEA